MDLPSLGHAVIVNNVLGEMPGSMEDVQALKATYETIGYTVQVHTNLNTQVSKIFFRCYPKAYLTWVGGGVQTHDTLIWGKSSPSFYQQKD